MFRSELLSLNQTHWLFVVEAAFLVLLTPSSMSLILVDFGEEVVYATYKHLLVAMGDMGCCPNEFGPTTIIYPLELGKTHLDKS